MIKLNEYMRKSLSKILICFVVLLIAFMPNSKVYAATKVINRGDSNLAYMSLTFDDGGSVENVKSVIDTLDKYEAKATFFFLGSFINQNPDIMKDIVARGHEVGNHSYSHPDFTKISYNKIINELNNSAEAFKNATGQDMKPYVRPPYGAKNASVLKAISDGGYTHTVMWNVDTNDWKKKSSSDLINHVLNNAGNGNIVLMHTTPSSNSAKALPKMIEGLQSKGYSLVTISELLSLSNTQDILKLAEDEISEVEFLNNLLYTKTGNFLATAKEIEIKSIEMGILSLGSTISFNKAYTKDEVINLIKLAYPLNPNIEMIFKDIELKKSNLELILQTLKSL